MDMEDSSSEFRGWGGPPFLGVSSSLETSTPEG